MRYVPGRAGLVYRNMLSNLIQLTPAIIHCSGNGQRWLADKDVTGAETQTSAETGLSAAKSYSPSLSDVCIWTILCRTHDD